MLKRIRWSRCIAAILFIVIVIIGVNVLIDKKSEATIKKSNEKIDNEMITNVKETALSDYPGLHLRTETTETGTYTSSISIPIAESDKVNEHLQNWIKYQKEMFFEEIKQNETQLNSDFRAHLNIQLSTEKINDQLYSLVFTSYVFSGGANGQTFVQPFIVDIKKDHVLQLDDIFHLNDEVVKEIRMLTLKELKKNEETYVYVDDELIEEALINPEDWKWSLNKKSFILHFNEYEIAAGAAGEIKVEIPIEKLSSFLNEKFASQIEIPLKKKEQDQEKIIQQFDKLDPNGKYVALTFDDGPSPKVTPRILSILKEHKAVATFFMLGNQVEYYPKVVEQVAKNGHEIGNHSKSHPDLTKLENKQIIKELIETNNKINKIIGYTPTAFRPPYGAWNDEVKKTATENNMTIVLWSVDSLDWKNRNPQTINQIIQRDVSPGSVVLMHDIHMTTADALSNVIAGLKEKGYEFVTVSQLVNLLNENDGKPFYGK